jgi:phosphotriesterase-related protein
VTRRKLLASLAAPALAAADPPSSILVHEHVMVDFIGAADIRPGRYDPEEVYRVARPKLEEVKALGCRRLLECTPDFIGRDARLIARLAEDVGIEIWTNTGLYGAANYKYVPEFAWRESAETLARLWVREARDGIDGVRPRFIKTGVNKGPLGEIDRKLVRAAGLTSLETGLTIASHTGDGRAALEQIEILDSLGVKPERFVWVHAQNERDHALHRQAARLGAWVEFDGIGPRSAAWHLECVKFMAAENLLERTLISQDAGWYHVGEPGGGAYRGYTYIYTDFVPQLEAPWRQTLLTGNPVRAFGD